MDMHVRNMDNELDYTGGAPPYTMPLPTGLTCNIKVVT